MTTQNSPKIETIINTIAIAATATGTTMILTKELYGFILIALGMVLEFFKYWGRKKEYW